MATWKTLSGFYDNYSVSTDGQVKSLITGKILKGYYDRKGYRKVYLTNDKSHKGAFIHRLVAIAFIPNPENKTQVNHIDGNKENNNINNLEWCDNRYNQIHAIKNHLRKNIREVYQYSKDNTFIKKWESGAEVMRVLGIDRGHINDCCNGKRKTAGGYKWSFEGVNA